MKTLKLTASDFKQSDGYWSDYIGKTDVTDYVGHIEISGRLGWVCFDRLGAKGHIWAGAGTGIEAGTGIKAGEGIKAGWGIDAGEGIKAGGGIEAGGGIKAGTGIEAGTGIVSGLSITCKKVLSFKHRLFAGVTCWQDVDNEDKLITCGKLEGGVVCYGDVKETGLDDGTVTTDKPAHRITLDGTEYDLVPTAK